jgi:hypothetical protein
MCNVESGYTFYRLIFVKRVIDVVFASLIVY